MAAEMIFGKVVESVASIAVGFIANQVQNYISGHFQFQPAFKDKLWCLVLDLRTIKAVLYEVDKRRIENVELGNLLLDIKDATYDAEDVLDMFEYKIIQEKVKGTASTVKKIIVSGDVVKKLNEVADKFKRIADRSPVMLTLINNQPEWLSESMQLLETTSAPIESKVFGRDKDGNMQALRFSNEHLPSYLKQCFVYCSLFPKGYRYEKTKLVQMWIAHGFILPSRQQLLEKIGEAYFNELLSRSFIHELYRDQYVIRDLLHDLAQSLSDGEIYIAENDEAPKKKVRHISICSNINLSLFSNEKLGNENLRSLVVFDCSVEKTSDVLRRLGFQGLNRLRVLVLDKFPGILSLKFIQKMLHLRYLEILRPYNQLGHFFIMPKLVCKLYHLQVLRPTKGIAGIGSLTFLRELEFDVNQGEKGFDIGQIRDMSELTTLCLEGLETVKTKEQASQAMLGNKRHLKVLKLKWEDQNQKRLSNRRGSRLFWKGKEDHHINLLQNEEDVLEGLQPPRNLEQLEIKGYRGSYPSWWNANWASNLITLELFNCSKWELLPPLGHLLFLKTLRIERMKAVRSIGREFYASNQLSSKTIFSSLEQLHIYDMPELNDWYKIEEEGGEGGGFELFPRLKNFRIGGCPKLRGSIFHFPPSNFNQIHMDISKRGFFYDDGTEGLIEVNCDSASIVREWLPSPDLLTSVEHLNITTREEMRSCFPTELVGWITHLNSLHSLCFSNCSGLESLPSNLISSLSTLRKLEIIRCPNIKSLPEEGLFLQELHVSRCYDLAKRCMNEYWQKMIAHIPTFTVDYEVVTEDNRKSLKTRRGEYYYDAKEEDEEE